MGKLKELLIQREREIAAGNYPSLHLKKQDIIRWELLHTRLSGLVQNAKETAKRISASPVVREMGECIFAVFTLEGESIALSDGLLIHISSIGSAIKWMLKNNYEEEEGIKEGDFFFNNDPHIGGAHSPDQLLLTPIVYEGEIVGWAGGLTHVPETGATEAGGSSPNIMSRFDEGIYWPCIRVGENWELNRNLERIVERGTRSPLWWLLDQRAKVAGIRIIRDGIIDLINEFGLDYFKKAVFEYIEDTRQATVNKLATLLFPGKYKSVVYFDVPYEGKQVRYPINHEMRIALEMTVGSKGALTLDFNGSSPAARHPFNCSLPCLVGNVMSWGMQQLLYDVKYNQGISQALCDPSVLKVPEKSCLNPGDTTYATAIFLSAFVAFFALNLAESRAHYPMGYREMVVAGHCTGSGMRCGGIDQYGRTFGGSLFEYTARGFPAMAVMDGLDAAYAMFNPAGDCGDAERWEQIFPLIYLGRRIWRDGGFGKFRGGNGLESLYMVINSDEVTMAATGGCDRVFNALGLMGGYPGPASYKYIMKDTDFKEKAQANMPLPHSEGDDPSNPEWTRFLKGESILTDTPTLATSLKSYDIWHQEVGGAGGYGDPIERAPDLVKKDLELGLTTLRTAEKVYCVKIDPQTFEIDDEVTVKLRETRKRERLMRGIPAKDYIKMWRERVLNGDIPPVPKSSLNQCLRASPKFLTEFRDFWNLPGDFKQIP